MAGLCIEKYVKASLSDLMHRPSCNLTFSDSFESLGRDANRNSNSVSLLHVSHKTSRS